MKTSSEHAVNVIIVTFLMLFTQQINAVSNIEGIWKHSEKQAWLNIDAVAGVVTVYVHHQANSAGLTVIKDVKPNSMS